jgi:hypothetical protein
MSLQIGSVQIGDAAFKDRNNWILTQLLLATSLPLNPQDAVNRAVAEGKRLTALLKRLPPDDGKVTITTAILLNDGLLGEEKGN